MMNILLKAFSEILYLGAISSIMIALILLIKKVFGRTISPKWHYYIWILLLVRLLIPFTPQSSLSALNLFYIGAQQLNLPVDVILAPLDNAENVNHVAGSPEFPVSTGGDNSGNTAAGTTNANATGNTADTTITDKTGTAALSNSGDTSPIVGSGQSKPELIMMVSAILWLSGMLLLTIYTTCINIIFVLKVRKNYKTLDNPRVNEILRECKRIVGIRKNISLYTTNRFRTPSLYSFFHTKILVSEAYLLQLSDRELKYVFLHELSHYKRKDITVNWILTLLQIIYFFNPLIWFSFYKIHEDCEISCDAEALKYLSEEEYQGYGSTVIKLIKLYSESKFIPATAGLWKHRSNYKRRIIMITKYKKSKWPSTLLTITLILIVGLIGLTGCKKADKDTSTDIAADITDDANDTDNNAEKTVTDTPTLTETPVSDRASDKSNLAELEELLGLSKEELISKLGDTYNVVDEGGLEFTNPGIRAWFDDKSITNQVYTDKSDIDFNGAKIKDSIESFKNVFGDTLSDNNGNAFFKYNNCYLSVYYDTDTKTVFAVYLLSEELGGVFLPETAETTSKDDPSSTQLSDDPAGSQTDETFFGDWVIDRVSAYGSVGTYSKEVAEGLIGKNLSFSTDSATCFGDEPSYLDKTAKNPIYGIDVISSDDFFTDYRMTLDQLGITADSVTLVSAYNSEGNGCTFLVKDDNTLIVIGGGTYFELVRKAK